MITSPKPCEGKTSTAVNLAVVTAQAGYKTILLDCDLRKPSIHKMFGTSNKEGITDLLIGSASYDEVYQCTEVDRLYILPAGTKPPNPSELLASNKMSELIKKLKMQYDYVIIDTSPIIFFTDAQLLSRYADGTILVASYQETDRDDAKKARELIEKVDSKILGVVLNKVKTPNKFYYDYNYYLEKDKKKIKEKKSYKKVCENIKGTDKCEKGAIYELIKRVIDISGSIFGLIITLPVLIITAVAIKIDSRGPVFFIQNRCGKSGKVFKMLKFRSMEQDAEDRLADLEDKNEEKGPVFKMRNDPRITRVGRFIRKTSIDELPQLINILLGQMSLVGPRPPIDREYRQYTDYQKQRLVIKPGLTCYWQVSGRNSIDFDSWVELDLKYIRERNLWIDIKLILKTLLVFLGDKNAY